MADSGSEVLLDVPLSPGEPATASPQTPKHKRTTKQRPKQKPRQKQLRRPRRAKSSSESFAIYFPHVLENVHVGLSLSPEAVSVMDSFVLDMFERIASEASLLTRKSQRITMTYEDIQTAVRLLLPGDLAKHAVSLGTQALLSYIQCQ